MVKITKVYTKKGDKGTTTLLGSNRIPKDAPEIKTLGALDELNAYVGWSVIALQAKDEQIKNRLLTVQNNLFDLGAFLCDSADYPDGLSTAVTSFEDEIDKMNEQLSPLKSFIFPGGNEAAARLHITRTVARRAEIELVTLAQTQPVTQGIPYLNRFSDWLFVAARIVNQDGQETEALWQPYG